MSGVPESARARVRAWSRHRCCYCLCPQDRVMGRLEIEHIIPSVAGGSDDESNLCLSCGLCNNYKGAQVYAVDPETKHRVRPFNPRRQRWTRHFGWSPDGVEVEGKTATGRATVAALRLNNAIAVTVRRGWVAGDWRPLEDEG